MTDEPIHYVTAKKKDRFFCGFPKFMGGFYARKRAGVTCPECQYLFKLRPAASQSKEPT